MSNTVTPITANTTVLGQGPANPQPVIQQYAQYGSAIYGVTVYGPQSTDYVSTSMTVSPVPHKVGLYDSLFVNWVSPGGTWTEQVLVRSSYGVPSSPFSSDGVVLLDEVQVSGYPQAGYQFPTTVPTYSTSFVDTNLQSGRIYYYALYVNNLQGVGGPLEGGQWLYCAGAWGMCITNFHMHDHLISWTPNFYLEYDHMIQPAKPLERFYGLMGWEMNWLRSEIESLYTLSSPEYISGGLLQYLAGNVGMSYEPSLGMQRNRVLIENAVNLYKIKGTQEGIEETASAFTGYGCEVSLGPNLEIQLDDAAFARTDGQLNHVGHWRPQNTSSTITEVASAQYGIVPQHASYQPIQGNTTVAGLYDTTYAVEGYLPPDGNQNVAQLTGTPPSQQYSWQNLFPSQALPGGRNNVAIAGDWEHNQTVMFGGQSPAPGNPWLNDTWTWTGAVWQRMNPTTSPSALQNVAMSYDPHLHNMVLVGWNPSTRQLETWIWNQSNWAQQHPATVPGFVDNFALSVGLILGVLMPIMVGYNPTTNTTQWFAWNNGWASAGNFPVNMKGMSMAYDFNTHLTYLTGGYQPTNTTNRYFQTWVWPLNNAWSNAGAGNLSGTTTGPAVGGDAAMAWNAQLSGGKVVLFDSANRMFSYTQSNNTWTLIEDVPAAPFTARANPGLSEIGNGSTGIILFGGTTAANYYLGDTWIATTGVWSLNNAQTYPQPRTDGAMIWNAGTQRIGLFSGLSAQGILLNDLWTWDSTNGWILRSQTGPSPRQNAQAVYWPTGPNNNIVMYGGLGANGAVLNDFWVWNATSQSWIGPVTLTGGPTTGRYGHMMLWDGTRFVVFGGIGPGGTWLNDLWYVTVTATATTATCTWTKQSPVNSPGPRSLGSFLNTSTGQSVLFGGYYTEATDTTGNIGGFLDAWNDTWFLNTSVSPPTWTQMVYAPALPPPPPARYSAVVANISGFGPMIFGGTGLDASGNGTVILSDAWYLNIAATPAQWFPFSMAPPEPLPRTQAMAALNASNNTVFFYGGKDVHGNVLGDTWNFVTTGAGLFGISECDPNDPLRNPTLTGLQIPQLATPPTYCLSAYFQPVPAATPTLRQFQMQIDWYGVNGALLTPSSTGAAITEVPGSWIRASVIAQAPVGAYYLGRTVKSLTALTGAANDAHLMDAVQTEINPTAQSVYSQQVLSLHPVGYYHMNDPNAVVMADASANNNYGSYSSTGVLYLQAPVAPSAGPNDYSVYFTGGSGTAPAPNVTDTFTLEAWIRPATVNSLMTVIDLGQAAGMLRLNSTTVEVGSSNTAVIAYSSNALAAGNVYHLVWTKSAATNHLYVNGADVTTLLGNVTCSAAASMNIGLQHDGVNPFKGQLDEVAVYNYALSAAQVTTNYNAGQTKSVAPAPWSPPRDIQVNLLPNRQNLAINGQGLANANGLYAGSSTYGWNVITGTMAAQQGGVTWPMNLRGGWAITTNASGAASVQAYAVPVNRMAFGGSDVMTTDEYQCSTFFVSFYVMPAAAASGTWTITMQWADNNGNPVGPVDSFTVGPEIAGQFVRFAIPNAITSPEQAEPPYQSQVLSLNPQAYYRMNDTLSYGPSTWILGPGTENSSFEGGTVGNWAGTSNCSVANSTAQAVTGTHSMAVTCTGGASPIVRLPVQFFPITQTQMYQLNVDFMPAATVRTWTIYIQYYNAAGTLLANASVNANETLGAWDSSYVTSAAPPGTVSASIQFVMSGTPAANEVHYIDNITLSVLPTQQIVSQFWQYGFGGCPAASFEDGTTGGWTAYQNSQITNTTSVTPPPGLGTHTLQIASLAAGDVYAALYMGAGNVVPIVPGVPYRLSMQLQAATTARQITPYISWYDSSRTNFIGNTYTNTTQTAAGVWTLCVHDVTAAQIPTGAAYASIGVEIHGTTAVGEVQYMDSVIFGPQAALVMADASGNNRNGVYQTTPNVTLQQPSVLPDSADPSVKLDGTFGAALFPPPVVNDNFTLEAWIKPTTVSGVQYIMQLGVNTTGMWLSGNTLNAGSNTSTVNSGSLHVLVNQYSHVVWTKAGSAQHLYINGVESTTITIVQAFANGATVPGVIGGQAGNGNFQYPFATSMFHGQIDEVAIYNYALTAAQVLANYETGVSTGMASTMTVGLNVTGAGASSVHYMAAPLIEPSGTLLPYFDGMTSPQPDNMFEGTPNASYSDYYPGLAPRVGRLVTVLPDYTPIGSTYSVMVGGQAAINAAAQETLEGGSY